MGSGGFDDGILPSVQRLSVLREQDDEVGGVLLEVLDVGRDAIRVDCLDSVAFDGGATGPAGRRHCLHKLIGDGATVRVCVSPSSAGWAGTPRPRASPR